MAGEEGVPPIGFVAGVDVEVADGVEAAGWDGGGEGEERVVVMGLEVGVRVEDAYCVGVARWSSVYRETLEGKGELHCFATLQ